MTAAPIGFFDSGLGGLCVRDAVRRLLPHESTDYIADSAHCPYGNKPAAEIRAPDGAVPTHVFTRISDVMP